jgi:hypothetical protein
MNKLKFIEINGCADGYGESTFINLEAVKKVELTVDDFDKKRDVVKILICTSEETITAYAPVDCYHNIRFFFRNDNDNMKSLVLYSRSSMERQITGDAVFEELAQEGDE